MFSMFPRQEAMVTEGVWATAWNELDQITWDTNDDGNGVGWGDTIYLDGGSVECTFPTYVTAENNGNKPDPSGCGMTYTKTLTIGASGTSDNPITIKLSSDSGKDGTAIIFGGRSTPLGGDGDANLYTGISIGNYNNVIIDGTKWGWYKNLRSWWWKWYFTKWWFK
jgi:hypothetical protein